MRVGRAAAKNNTQKGGITAALIYITAVDPLISSNAAEIVSLNTSADEFMLYEVLNAISNML